MCCSGVLNCSGFYVNLGAVLIWEPGFRICKTCDQTKWTKQKKYTNNTQGCHYVPDVANRLTRLTYTNERWVGNLWPSIFIFITFLHFNINNWFSCHISFWVFCYIFIEIGCGLCGLINVNMTDHELSIIYRLLLDHRQSWLINWFEWFRRMSWCY